jgi:penicillin amidase
MDAAATMRFLAAANNDAPLHAALGAAAIELAQLLGEDRTKWAWGRLHTVKFEHPLRAGGGNQALLDRGPLPRPGDGNTVNAASGGNFRQTAGASYRQIFDLADWDRSVMTNVPGESGDPNSRHYSDLLEDWAAGRYHPMPYSRKAVEEATVEKILLIPLS